MLSFLKTHLTPYTFSGTNVASEPSVLRERDGNKGDGSAEILSSCESAPVCTPKRVLFVDPSDENDTQLSPQSHSPKPSCSLSSSTNLVRRGILKPHAAGQFPEDSTAEVSLKQFLVSAKERLAQNDRIEVVDTYNSLLNTLRAMECTDSHTTSLLEMVPFVKRDIMTQLDGTPDNVLRSSATKLLGYLWHDDLLAATFSREQVSFFLSSALKLLANNPSKVTMQLQLWLLQTQRLQSKLISDHIPDIVRCVSKIDSPNCAVQMERLGVFKTLIFQSPVTMHNFLRPCLYHMFVAFAMSHFTLLSRATELADALATVYPRDKRVTEHVFQILNQGNESHTVLRSFNQRCESLIQRKEADVALEIWASLTALMGGKRILAWRDMNTWLEIVQSCLNSRFTATKCKAQAAWQKFIVVVCQSEPKFLHDRSIRLLLQPAHVYLSPTGHMSSQAKISAFAAFKTLYIALWRPELSQADAMVLWDEVVSRAVYRGITSPDSKNLSVEFLGAVLAPQSPIAKGINTPGACAASKTGMNPMCPKFLRAHKPVLDIVKATASIDVWRAYFSMLRQAEAKEIKLTRESLEASEAVLLTLQSVEAELLPAITTCLVKVLDLQSLSDGKITLDDKYPAAPPLVVLFHSLFKRRIDLSCIAEHLKLVQKNVSHSKFVTLMMEMYTFAEVSETIWEVLMKSFPNQNFTPFTNSFGSSNALATPTTSQSLSSEEIPCSVSNSTTTTRTHHYLASPLEADDEQVSTRQPDHVSYAPSEPVMDDLVTNSAELRKGSHNSAMVVTNINELPAETMHRTPKIRAGHGLTGSKRVETPKEGKRKRSIYSVDDDEATQGPHVSTVVSQDTIMSNGYPSPSHPSPDSAFAQSLSQGDHALSNAEHTPLKELSEKAAGKSLQSNARKANTFGPNPRKRHRKDEVSVYTAYQSISADLRRCNFGALGEVELRFIESDLSDLSRQIGQRRQALQKTPGKH